MERRQREPWWSTGPTSLFAFSVGFPSAAKAEHYAGAPGVALYLTGLAAALWVAARVDVDARVASISRRRANVILVTTFVVLAMAFVMIHPIVTGGSDRDEALDLATRELLHGHFPYYHRVFATNALPVPNGGNKISPMPGELLLAVPFVLLGSGAWQTLFWLAVFFYVSRAVLQSQSRALLTLGSMLVLCPAALHEILTGGDLLANGLWVLVLGALVVDTRGGFKASASGLLLGTGLSSRPHFALLLPVLIVVLAQRHGWRAAVVRCALTIAGFAAVTLPFYLHDRAGFSPLHVAGKFRVLDWGVPHTVAVASVVGSIVAAAAVAVRESASDAWALATSAIVLSVPVVVAVILACARFGAYGFGAFGWYAVGSMPFGVLATFAAGSKCREHLQSVTKATP